MSAKWIWYSGDFELYHSMLLHTRRKEYEHAYPVMWHLSRPEFTACFTKSVDMPEETRAAVLAHGNGYITVKGRKYPLNTEVPFPAGQYDVTAEVFCLETFPSLYIDSPSLKTDESWIGHFNGGHRKYVGCEPAFTSPQDDPAVFPFAIKVLEPVSVEETNGGKLYDFGVESFGPVTVKRTAVPGRVDVYYGESREEALDTEFAYLREHLPAGEEDAHIPAKAFRYIFLKPENSLKDLSGLSLQACLEYLPIEDIASFTSDDSRLPAIWEICSRAFHLNSREFFLDGIKRDRWVWSGDAYQSFMVNRYLYAEPQITKRTIRALLDRPPYYQHINTINDYSSYMFLAVYDYYFATGDAAFVRDIWDQLSALYRFITERLDAETGYMVARPGDWVFIDWADIDKDGPLCAEQILLYMVYRSMALLSKVAAGNQVDFGLLGSHREANGSGSEADTDPYFTREDFEGRAGRLKERIMKDFWDEDAKAFIDTYASGRHHITRHANIFAILYDFVDDAQKEAITQKVLLSDSVDPITTPYFKLFELMALAKMGRLESVQDYIDSYWGGMIDNGATSAWEEFDPRKSGAEHYAMYGEPYGCSLCHAWGSGPILLLGQYCAGVRPTSVGTETFEVAPKPGRYKSFRAVVPVANGKVEVTFADGRITALADVPGGVLKWNGKEAVIPAVEAVQL